MITFSLTPVISRIFDPSDFGVAALFVSIATIISVAAPLCYDRAVVLPEEDERGALLAWLALLSLIAVSGLGMLVLGLLYVFGIPLPFADRIGAWIWLVPATVLLMGFIKIQEGWLTRSKRFKVMAASDVTQALLTTGGRLSCGALWGSSVWALIAGQLAGLVGQTLLMLRMAHPSSWSAPGARSWKALQQVAREFKDFPLYNATAAFTLSFSMNLPVLVLGYMFAPEIVGFYAMANRLARIPLNITAHSVRRVYLQRAAMLRNNGKPLRGMLTKTTVFLVLLGAVPFGIFWLYGEQFLTVFLGERWRKAGHFVEILVPWLYMIWNTIPSGALMVVLRKQALWLRIQVGGIVTRLGVFLVAYLMAATPEQTLTAFVAVSVLGQLIIIAITFRLERKDWEQRAQRGGPNR
ncbi:hypothetical protein MNBD_GAMMA24-929 [hydrothermal vent metagenome]|uniref:O-antigen flippase Wzx n=1 Tax=hydrothermal vent metagenome TaxID=652676 RepID=A0A3B1BQ69_9ZZZZ